jgi:hypothetical protein
MNILTVSNLMEKEDFTEAIQLLIEEGTCKTEKAAWNYIQKFRKTPEYQAKLLLHIMQETSK